MTHCHTILTELRKKGYRITPQRESIILAVAHSPKHLTAEDLAEELKGYSGNINIATIYRTLDLLWQEGFACRNDLSEGKSVYAAYQHGPHIHLVCRKCDRILDADNTNSQFTGRGFDHPIPLPARSGPFFSFWSLSELPGLILIHL